MTSFASALLQCIALVVVLLAIQAPLGNYIARQLQSQRHLRVESALYRLIRVDAEADQRWSVYARSVIAFSAVSIGLLYVVLRLQSLPPHPQRISGMSPWLAFNTAISFVTNTNWQAYAGETGVTPLTQMIGLTVQNFASAAVGIAVAVALVRGFARTHTQRVGNFWVDLVRIVVRLLLPAAFVFGAVLILCGVPQTFADLHSVHTLAGETQSIITGPIASQESIKLIGTNGGGFFNANSAHPFENPSGFTNWLEILMLLAIPFSLPRAFGTIIGDRRQGRAILATMAVLWAGSVALLVWSETSALGAAAKLAGGGLEGKEVRFGVPMSAVFAASTTATSTGAVDAAHDSLSAFGGGISLLNMVVGELAPGGTGSGLYGMLIVALVTVFVSGLMVGRTPEYVGKRLGAREMKLVSLYILTSPALALAGLGLALATGVGRSGILNPGPHGLSEVFYAFASAANNNGSAFAGLGANSTFYNIALGVVMMLGRFLPMLFILALAGSFAEQGRAPETSGTLPTHRTLFVGLTASIVIVIAGLTFVPAFALGALAEGLS